MSTYEFVGEGLALNSTIVVLARREDDAWRLARIWMIDHLLDHRTLGLVSTKKAIETPDIVYAWNGDY